MWGMGWGECRLGVEPGKTLWEVFGFWKRHTYEEGEVSYNEDTGENYGMGEGEMYKDVSISWFQGIFEVATIPC